MKTKETRQGIDRLSPTPRANIDVNIKAVRQIASSRTTVYFETHDAFEQSEMGRARTLKAWGIVYGRLSRLYKTGKGEKRGTGSALIMLSETGTPIVLPNDGNKRDAENIMTIDAARKLFASNSLMFGLVKNAIRTNREHRRQKFLPKSGVLYRRTR